MMRDKKKDDNKKRETEDRNALTLSIQRNRSSKIGENVWQISIMTFTKAENCDFCMTETVLTITFASDGFFLKLFCDVSKMCLRP